MLTLAMVFPIPKSREPMRPLITSVDLFGFIPSVPSAALSRIGSRITP